MWSDDHILVAGLPDKKLFPSVSAVYGNTEVSMVYLGPPLDGWCPQYCPLIGQYWSHDRNTGLWLVVIVDQADPLKVILELNFICIMLFNGDISWSMRSNSDCSICRALRSVSKLQNFNVLFKWLLLLFIMISSILCTKYCTLVPVAETAKT